MSAERPRPTDGENVHPPGEHSALEDAQAELARLTAEASALAEEVTGTQSLERRRSSSPEAATEARVKLDHIRAQLAAKQQEMEAAERRARQAIELQQQALRDAVARQRQAMEGALAPVRKLVARLEEGIGTMSLYLGIGEQIITVCDGAHAEALEPIVLRQMVLAMDEESGLFAEEEGMSVEDVDSFDDWLRADPAHVEQIVPDRKGVVAMVARWTRRSERDFMREPEDQLTHLLIRNGEAVYRISVEFHAGDALLPRADEFIGYFFTEHWNHHAHEFERVAITPGTREYEQAMERSDARSRHYLRIGLILQGLVDRTEIFHPLHPAGVNMLSDPAERSERVRIILDAEGGLESGLQTFSEWQAEVNAQLRPGVRIVGAFNTAGFRDSLADEGPEAHRIHPRNAEKPPSGVPLLIEDRAADGGLVIRYEREQEIWDPKQWTENPDRPGWGWHGGSRKPKQRASCVIYPDDRFVLPYDMVDAATLQRFLGERRNRRGYKALWPLLRQVMFAKRAEEAAETPFRIMLAGVLARENHVSVAEAESEIPALVRWFKLANRWHRPLVFRGRAKKPDQPAGETGSASEQAKAVRLICAEHRRRLQDRSRIVRDDVVEQLRQQHPGFLVIARPRRGGYLVLTPCDERDVHVDVHQYTAAGEAREVRRWQLVGARAERWTVIASSERWDRWDRLAAPQQHITGPEREQFCEQIKRTVAAEGQPLLAITQKEFDGSLYAWVISQGCEFDPACPLSSEPRAPEHVMRTGSWTRKGNGPATLKLSGYGSQYGGGRGGSDPLEGRYGDSERRLVLFRDAAALATWREQWRLYEDAERFRAPLVSALELAIESVERTWLSGERERARERFLRGGRPEDWPAAEARLKLEFPYSRSRLRFTITRHDTQTWVKALAIALESGAAVHGMALRDVLAVAVDSGLRGGWVPLNADAESSSKTWSEDALPELEEGLADLTVDLTPPPAVPPGEVAAPDGEGQELGDEHDGDQEDLEAHRLSEQLLETMADALRPKRGEEDEVLFEREEGDILAPE
jgi:hypothetical protein